VTDPKDGDVFALVTVCREGLRVTIGFENSRAAWRYALRRGVAHRARPARVDFDSYLSGQITTGTDGAVSVGEPAGPLPWLLRAVVVGWWFRRPAAVRP
jgi:hypothetical protein